VCSNRSLCAREVVLIVEVTCLIVICFTDLTYDRVRNHRLESYCTVISSFRDLRELSTLLSPLVSIELFIPTIIRLFKS